MAAKDPKKEEELDELLSIDLNDLDELDFVDEDDKAKDRKVAETILEKAKSEEKKKKQVSAEEASFQKILKSPLALKFEKSLQEENEVKAEANKFLGSLEQISVADRTSLYKESVQQQYNQAVKEVKLLYQALAKGQQLEYSRIKNIVNAFLKIFITDRCILLNLSSLNEKQEDYLFNHAVNVCLLTLNIATASGFSKTQVIEMGTAGLLADIGMMKIPESIRSKAGPLNREELFEIWKHPILGIHCLEKVGGLPQQVSYVAYQHHERQSGTGYPKMRKGRIIHAYSRIVAIADVYQAIISDRCYRNKISPHQAMLNIIKMSKKGMLNSYDVLNFTRFASVYPVGSLVLLSSGCIAKVTESNFDVMDKPIISVLTNNKQQALSQEKIFQVDLATHSTEKVTKALGFNEFKGNIMAGF